MTPNSEIARAVRHALVMSAVATASLTSLTARAQEQAPEQEQGEAIQTVTVTGTRIQLPNLTSISPVTAVSNDEVRYQGTTRVEDLVNNLPQAFADFGGNLSNGATGAATVNLRNLESQRTLVLINGRRLMPGDPTQNGAASPDLNQIPAALIDRIEVLTGGASAVYGADAVAGVVNFIMMDNFEGVRFDGQYSFYQHNNDNALADTVRARGFGLPDSNVRDGYAKDATVIAGINTPDGRGNATVYVGYRDLAEIRQDQRDFSACALGGGDVFSCSGSGTTAPARLLTRNGGDFVVSAGGDLIDYDGDRDAFNFAPDNFYQRPDERKTAGLFAHYEVNDHARLYTEFMFMDDRTIAQIAASGAFLGGGPGQPPFFGDNLVNCDNPFLSPQAAATLCGDPDNLAPPNPDGTQDAFVNIGRRNVEGGGRRDDLRHTSYRAVLGSRGDITGPWTYDVYGLYGETVYAENYSNDFSRTRLARALTAVPDPDPASPTFGQPICRINADADLNNDDPTCVPYNIFQPGGVTPEALAYLQVPGVSKGTTTEQIASGSISGDLGEYGVKLPGATDGLGIAVGAEYRQEESELRTDLAFQTNDLAGQGAPTLDTFGLFNVREVFVEARLPILQEQRFAQTLSFEAGYRFSDYSLGFNTDTYKFGADWAPVDDVRFRASYQRAVRAPNIQELFLQQRVQLNGNSDPCASETGELPAASFEACARSGVTAAQYGNILANPAEQYNGLVGGNPDLDPESSDTVSFGFVLTPQALPGLSVAVDYYDIKVDDVIDQLGQDFILNQCLASGAQEFCSLINRSPANGSLWLGDGGFVVDPFINTGSLQTKGVDLDANYRIDLGENIGRLSFSLIGTYVDEFVTEPLSDFGIEYDCVGLYGTVCGIPIPEWRHKLRATWSSPLNFDVSLSWRFIDSVDVDASSSNPALAGEVIPTDATLGRRHYIDLTGSYTFRSVTGRIGINNLFDKDPPVISQSSLPSVLGNGNTFPQVYDTLGRYVFLGLTADF